MKDIRNLLRETLIVKGISPEQAAGYLNCSGMQVRRWIKYKAVPGLLHRKAIEEGIKRIEKEVPDIIKKPSRIYRDEDGMIKRERGEAVWTGEKIEETPEDKEIAEKVLALFNELAQKVHSSEKSVLDYIADSMGEIIELFQLAHKYGVKLPKI